MKIEAYMSVDPQGGALFFRNDVRHVATIPLVSGYALAASQAREQQLREALKALQQGFPQTHQINAVIRHVLVTPQDDAALRQWGAELLNKVIPAENELGLGASYEDAAYVNGWNDCQYEVIRKADELEAER